MGDQKRQDDGGALQDRHPQGQQRHRDHAEPGKAALAEPEQDHGRHGDEIEQRVGDHGRGPAARGAGDVT